MSAAKRARVDKEKVFDKYFLLRFDAVTGGPYRHSIAFEDPKKRDAPVKRYFTQHPELLAEFEAYCAQRCADAKRDDKARAEAMRPVLSMVAAEADFAAAFKVGMSVADATHAGSILVEKYHYSGADGDLTRLSWRIREHLRELPLAAVTADCIAEQFAIAATRGLPERVVVPPRVSLDLVIKALTARGCGVRAAYGGDFCVLERA